MSRPVSSTHSMCGHIDGARQAGTRVLRTLLACFKICDVFAPQYNSHQPAPFTPFNKCPGTQQPWSASTCRQTLPTTSQRRGGPRETPTSFVWYVSMMMFFVTMNDLSQVCMDFSCVTLHSPQDGVNVDLNSDTRITR